MQRGEDTWKKFKERRDRVRRERKRERSPEKREREKGEEIQKRKERRKNVVWRGVEEGSVEERRRVMAGIITEKLGREVEISEVKERKGTAGIVLIAKMEKQKDRMELRRARRLGETGGVGIDENLTMEGRRVRWRLMERARTERAKGKMVITTNRRV